VKKAFVVLLLGLTAAAFTASGCGKEEEKAAWEKAQLEEIAAVSNPKMKIERYEQLLDEKPSAKTRARVSRYIVKGYFEDLGDENAAVKRAREILASEDDSEVRGYVYYTLFEYYRKTDPEETVRLCEEVIDSGREPGWLYNTMGWTLCDRDTLLDLAGELCSKAVENAEDDQTKAGALDSRGWVKFKQHKFDEAVSDLEAARKLQSEPDAEVLFHLARAYGKVNRDEEAIELGIELLSRSMDPEIRSFVEDLYRRKHGSLKGLEETVREKRLAASWEAPDFTLADLDGNQVSLSEHRGKVVALVFWSPT